MNVAYRSRQFYRYVIFGNRQSRSHFFNQLYAKILVWRGSVFLGGQAPAALQALKAPSEKIKIGVAHSGTLGDKINLSRFISAIKNQYPNSLIFIFDTHAKFNVVFDRNEMVNGIFRIREYALGKTIKWLLRSNYVDIFYENKYVVKTYFGKRSKIPPEQQQKLNIAFAPLEDLFNKVPWQANAVLDYCKKLNLSEWDIMEISSLLPVNRSRPNIPVSFEEQEFILNKIGNLPFVTVHAGAFIPDYLKGEYKKQTKNWSMEKWASLIGYISSLGVKVYQIALSEEELIPNADHTLVGKLNFHQTAAVLKSSMLHIDTEGGLVHLARAVGTNSVVLFGPTPVHFFSHADNINIWANVCSPCCWSTSLWMFDCPKGYAEPLCMARIEVSSVIHAIDQYFCDKLRNPLSSLVIPSEMTKVGQ